MEKVFGDHTHEELKEAFAKVKNKKNWKGVINAKVDRANFNITFEAVAFFTGSQLEIVEVLGDKYKVHAAGYYSAIGS